MKKASRSRRSSSGGSSRPPKHPQTPSCSPKAKRMARVRVSRRENAKSKLRSADEISTHIWAQLPQGWSVKSVDFCPEHGHFFAYVTIKASDPKDERLPAVEPCQEVPLVQWGTWQPATPEYLAEQEERVFGWVLKHYRCQICWNRDKGVGRRYSYMKINSCIHRYYLSCTKCATKWHVKIKNHKEITIEDVFPCDDELVEE